MPAPSMSRRWRGRSHSGRDRRERRTFRFRGFSRRRVRPGPTPSTPVTGSFPRTRRSRAAVEDAGLLWIGPPPAAIEQMGDKLAARRRARRAGVPVVPGTDGSETDDAALAAKAAEIGFPVLVKPSAGGGGKGMSVVETAEELPGALEEGRRVAEAAFGDGRVYLEKAPGEAQARRVPGLRRPAGQRRPPLRARVQRPAPAPEGRRGDAERGAGRPSAGGDGPRGRGGGPRRRLLSARAPWSSSSTSAGTSTSSR